MYGWGFAVLFLYNFPFLFGYILYLYFGLFLAQKYFYGRRSILWIGLKQIAENRWYLSMLFGVYADIFFFPLIPCSSPIQTTTRGTRRRWRFPPFTVLPPMTFRRIWPPTDLRKKPRAESFLPKLNLSCSPQKCGGYTAPRLLRVLESRDFLFVAVLLRCGVKTIEWSHRDVALKFQNSVDSWQSHL